MSKTNQAREQSPVPITRASLANWPLPRPDEQGDKNNRGSVLIIGGSTEMPGAVVLAATAALRSGAGRLRIATGKSIAAHVGVAVPEARVFQLPETPSGGIDPAAHEQLAQLAGYAQAVLIGPGMIDSDAINGLLQQLLPQINEPVLVLDAGTLRAEACNPANIARHDGKVILTPHAGEMAHLLGMDEGTVSDDPTTIARQAATDFRAVIALKGATTSIASPEGTLYHYTEGHVGLATSGSGDTLAGIIVGLAARETQPVQAAAWGVYLHGEAGNRLAQRLGPLGFLARELSGEVPAIMAEVSEDGHEYTSAG